MGGDILTSGRAGQLFKRNAKIDSHAAGKAIGPGEPFIDLANRLQNLVNRLQNRLIVVCVCMRKPTA